MWGCGEVQDWARPTTGCDSMNMGNRTDSDIVFEHAINQGFEIE